MPEEDATFLKTDENSPLVWKVVPWSRRFRASLPSLTRNSPEGPPSTGTGVPCPSKMNIARPISLLILSISSLRRAGSSVSCSSKSLSPVLSRAFDRASCWPVRIMPCWVMKTVNRTLTRTISSMAPRNQRNIPRKSFRSLTA